MRMKNSMLLLFALGTFASCTKVVTKEKPVASNDHYMTNTSATNIHEVVDGNINLSYMTKAKLQQLVDSGSVTKTDMFAAIRDNDLVLGYPEKLLGEQSVFGGVITKVSDGKNSNIGDLKLTDLGPFHVTSKYFTQVETLKDETGTPIKDANGKEITVERKYIGLTGCMKDCDETSPQIENLIAFEIMAVDNEQAEGSDSKKYYLNLSSLGQGLDIMQMLDAEGEVTKLIPLSSATTTFDYDLKTLVFDIKSTLVPVGTGTTDAEEEAAPKTYITARWYLRLGSVFNPAFIPRAPIKEVGFFKTAMAKDVKIIRHSLTDEKKTLHYMVKKVPEKYKKHVEVAIANWNKEFKAITERKTDFISFEFIPENDPRNETVIAGDIRYNVIEWDLNNEASYGGLGPSIGNQFTGEIMSTNILLQGPRIVDMYSKWFEASAAARTLIAQGREAEADKLFKDYVASAQAQVKRAKAATYSVSVGKLKMTVRSKQEELQDPIVAGMFELVPAGMTFDTYMPGYFEDMIQHEMGHNMGLRHNFYGSLGAVDTTGNGLTMNVKGTVSRSVMEYLGRAYRYKDGIGAYDRMAIAYGYKGVAPKHADWFCTDEDQGLDARTISVRSPECSKSDATNDPFTYWQARLDRAIEVTVAPSTSRAPMMSAKYIATELGDIATAFAEYALSAEKTSDNWLAFFGRGDRPEKGQKAEIKAYVIKTYTDQLCNTKIADAISAKESVVVQEATKKNYDAVVAAVEKKMTDLGLLKENEKICK